MIVSFGEKVRIAKYQKGADIGEIVTVIRKRENGSIVYKREGGGWWIATRGCYE
jgi:hypothetical protein